MLSDRNTARCFGAFFIFTFLTYGLGSGLMASLTGADNPLSAIHQHTTQLVFALVLMSVLHTIANIALPILMWGRFSAVSARLTVGYLAFAIAATVTLIVGTVLNAMQIPLADAYAKNPQTWHLQAGQSLTYGAVVCYQLGMAIWGVGGLLMTVVLFRSGLVPGFLPIWGGIGYVVFIAGTQLELFGYPFGVMLSLPGGLFEITLSVWLIVKGFKTTS